MNYPRNPPPTSPLPRPSNRRQFNEAVHTIVRAIPKGKVLTYGDIARMIPCPRSLDELAYRRIRSRWVGYALSDCPEQIPWQRVVNRHGAVSRRSSGGHLLQKALLLEEDVAHTAEGTVDLEDARWHPKGGELAVWARALRRSWEGSP